jgi:hypothetical protein
MKKQTPLTLSNPALVDRWTGVLSQSLTEGLEVSLAYAGTHPPQAISMLCEQLTYLEDLVQRRPSLPAAVAAFVYDTTEWEVQRDRVAALHSLEVIRSVQGAPLRLVDARLGPVRSGKRLLRPLELGCVRLVARHEPLRALRVALLDAGASSGELTDVHADHFAFDPAHAVQRIVRLRGGRGLHPRTVCIPSWATSLVTPALAAARHPSDVLYTGNRTGQAPRQSSILMSVTAVFQVAGLAEDPAIAPESIRRSAARELYDASGGDLRAARARLGFHSYDLAAKHLGLEDPPPL